MGFRAFAPDRVKNRQTQIGWAHKLRVFPQLRRFGKLDSCRTGQAALPLPFSSSGYRPR